MIDSWNYDRSQHNHSERCNLRAIITVLVIKLLLSLVIAGPSRRRLPRQLREISLLSWSRVSGLWLGKIMKAGVEWLLTTATGRAELRARIMTERAAILLRTFNYLGDGRTVTSVIETYICRNRKNVNHVSFVCLRISTMFAKKCPKKLPIIIRYVFCQHGQLLNSTLPPRHCYWVTRVVRVTLSRACYYQDMWRDSAVLNHTPTTWYCLETFVSMLFLVDIG